MFIINWSHNNGYAIIIITIKDFDDKVHKHDILKSPKCSDGYLIVKMNPKDNDVFYGCTNYYNEKNKCKYMRPLPNDPI